MSGARREGAAHSPPADEEFIQAYADGYGEGLREAFREMLGHAARGHTPQELRMLIESRLARLSDDIELKRKSLLGPPRPSVWGPLLRTPSPPKVWTGPQEGPPPPELPVPGPMESYLVREERPVQGPSLVSRALAAFPRAVLVSVHRPAILAPAGREVVAIDLTSPASSGGIESATLAPGEIGGRIRAQTERQGGAVVYVDALEFLTSEFGLDSAVRFVQWLVTHVQVTHSALVVSLDPRALDDRDVSRLQRAFSKVL